MNKFEIYTDCTSDLSPDLVSLMDVKVIPMLYCVNGQEEYFSPGDCNKKSPPFYNALRAGESANTTLINTERYIEIFSPELEAGRDVLYIAFSSGLSGSFNCARIASGILNEKYPDSKLLIVDSLSASLGEGLLVWHTCERRREGISIDDTAKWVEQNATKLCHWFTVDDLNHLKRGGRLSAAAAAVGTVLNIKPVLHVDDEGHLIPISKVRGRTASLDALLDEMGKTAVNPESQTIFIGHGDAEKDAQYVADECRRRFGVKQIYINFIGPIIGTHSGPGTIALFFIGGHR